MSKQTKQPKEPKAEFIGEEFSLFQGKVSANQKVAAEADKTIEAAFTVQAEAVEQLKLNRTPAALAWEKGDESGLKEVMAQNRALHKKIARAQQDARSGIVQLNEALQEIDALRTTGQIWRSRCEIRVSDASEFRRLVASINISFSTLSGRLEHLKLKVEKLQGPSEPDTGIPECPRCHRTDTVALVSADAHVKTYSCSTVICENFEVPLHISAPESVSVKS